MRATEGLRTTEIRRRAAMTPAHRMTLRQRVWRDRWMYLFILPGFLYFVVFRYLPYLGNIIAFQDYSPFLGFHSPWVGLANFRRLFTDPDFVTALTNTLEISFLSLLFSFPAPIILALLLNSMISERAKRVVQSIVYLPHFIGWVIVIALWQQIFGGDGFINQFLRIHDHATVNIMSNPTFFKPLVIIQQNWKNIGWGTIIFLAALTRIDPELYEAAAMDGANGPRRLWHITLPGIRGIIVLVLILRLGHVLNTDFEQILLQRDAVGAKAGEVLDTFVYFRGIQGGDWGFTAAVGLVKGLVGATLVFAANRAAKTLGEGGLF
ncbi:MAG: ABC transporter permease [Thermomicrobiales bacterium]